MGGNGHAGAGAPERYIQRSEVGGDGAGASGGDHSRLGLLEQPLDGLAVGLVTQFARELEDPSGAECRHSDTAASAVDLGVSVLGRSSLRGWLLGGFCGGAAADARGLDGVGFDGADGKGRVAGGGGTRIVFLLL